MGKLVSYKYARFRLPSTRGYRRIVFVMPHVTIIYVSLKSGYKYVLEYMCMYVYARVRAKKYVADYAAKFITISIRRALVSPNNTYLRATIASVFVFSRRTTALGSNLVNQVEFKTTVPIPLCA